MNKNIDIIKYIDDNYVKNQAETLIQKNGINYFINDNNIFYKINDLELSELVFLCFQIFSHFTENHINSIYNIENFSKMEDRDKIKFKNAFKNTMDDFNKTYPLLIHIIASSIVLKNKYSEKCKNLYDKFYLITTKLKRAELMSYCYYYELFNIDYNVSKIL